MSIAIVYPGQGAQFQEMGSDFYQCCEMYRTYFDALKKKYPHISDAINGVGDLNNTANAQLAIFANQVAITEAINQLYDTSDATYAGFSLGEYNAYYSAGLFDYETGLDIIDKRSKLMASVESDYITKVCIGLTKEQLTSFKDELNEELDSPLIISNHNNETQLLINFNQSDEGYITEKIKLAGAKRILPIAISGPFHTCIFSDAKEQYAKFLETVELGNVTNDLYLNVDGQRYTETTDIKHIMVDHLTTGVAWYPQITNMINDGVTTFVEVGSKSVLASMIKKIDRSVKVITIESIDDLRKLEDVWNKK